MTKLLDKAIEAAKQLSPDEQDELAHAILHLVENSGEPEEIDPEHLPGVLEGLAQAERGEFATEQEVEEAFRSFEPKK
jgi:predicted transcriptional regulator